MELVGREVWRQIKGYENFYEVSNYGRVRSVDRFVKGKINQEFQFKNGILKEFIPDSKGYLRVCLWKYNKRKHHRVHHLVALAFPEICGDYFDGAEIDHLNTIITDNRAINLKWVTHKENANNPLTIEHKIKTKSPC